VTRIAFTTPLPPQATGVAAYSVRLLAALRDLVEVDVYVDGPPHQRDAIVHPAAPDGLTVRPLGALARVEAFAGAYDAVVYSLGNSEFHTGSLASLLRRRGIVLAHDVRLSNLYRFAQWQHPAVVAPGQLDAAAARMYGDAVSFEQVERWGLAMAREAIGASTRFLTTSTFAANLARLDARPGDRDRIASVGFAMGTSPLDDPTPPLERPGPPVVASFGVVNRSKQGPLLVEAFAAAAPGDARLVFVGPAGAEDRAAIARRADDVGIGSRVEVCGEVDAAVYARWLDRAWLAVQLRASTNGESSAAIGDCLAAGLPTIVTGIGANRELPSGAVAAVAPDVDAFDLASVIRGVLGSRDRRQAMGMAAAAHAASRSFARAAQDLYEVVVSSSSR
jgi:glycosyltransferase involved in cell wall biosynthesis